MAARLGATLVEHALAPLREIGGMLAASRVAEALEQLVPERLEAALREGVEAIAKRADVKPAAIEDFLPRPAMADALQRLRTCQQNALAAWKQHAGGLGGLLTGVGEVTVESETPEVGWYLSRLAGKLVRDKRLSGPLDALSVSVTEWQELVLAGARAIDDSRTLSRSFWIRLARVAVLLATLAVAIVWLVKSELVKRAARARVEAALSANDPCLVQSLSSDDVRRAGGDAEPRLSERRRQCEAEKERARREAACEALTAHVEEGRLSPEDEALAPEALRPLLRRIASGALESDDLSLGADALAALPCPAQIERIWAVFGRAAAKATAAWATATTVSAHVRTKVAAQGGLSSEARHVLVDLSEAAAKRGVFQGDDASLEEAKRLCALAGDVGIRGEKWCTALGVALQKRAR